MSDKLVLVKLSPLEIASKGISKENVLCVLGKNPRSTKADSANWMFGIEEDEDLIKHVQKLSKDKEKLKEALDKVANEYNSFFNGACDLYFTQESWIEDLKDKLSRKKTIEGSKDLVKRYLQDVRDCIDELEDQVRWD